MLTPVHSGAPYQQGAVTIKQDWAVPIKQRCLKPLQSQEPFTIWREH